MSETRGIFSLSDAIDKKLDSEWVNPSSSWFPVANTGGNDYGYFLGGRTSAGAVTSVIEKLEYASDTTEVSPTSLPNDRWFCGAVAGQMAGYFVGGSFTSPVAARSDVDKLVFATDSITLLPSTKLDTDLYRLGTGATSHTAAYFGGGYNPSTNERSTYQKITYATDTTTNFDGLYIERRAVNGFSNPSNAYFAGGDDNFSTLFTSFDKLFFATDTSERIPSTNMQGDPRTRGISSSNGDIAYICGGINPSTGNHYTDVNKVTLATDTCGIESTAALGNDAAYKAGTASSTNGYYGGGVGAAPTYGNNSTMEKIDFTTDTRSPVPVGGYLRNEFAQVNAMSSRANGLTPTIFSPIKRFSDGAPSFANGAYNTRVNSNLSKTTFANDTVTEVPHTSTALTQRGYQGAFSSPTDGYYAGGSAQGSVNTTIEKLTYATDVRKALTGANQSTITGSKKMGCSATTTEGYFMGGGSMPTFWDDRSDCSKFTFSTDTNALLPNTALLSSNRYGNFSLGSPTAGYTGGGLSNMPNNGGSQIDKLTYSNSTVSQGILNVPPGWWYAGAGTSDIGYLSTGQRSTKNSETFKITYATDAFSPVPSATIPTSRNYASAAAAPSFGYWSGGQDASGSQTDVIEKIDFVTELSYGLPAKLPEGRMNLASVAASENGKTLIREDAIPPEETPTASDAIGSYQPVGTAQNQGYISGGYWASYSDTVKIKFATDTLVPLPAMTLSSGRYGSGSTANTNYGYIFGGYDPAGYIKDADKATLATNTMAVLPSSLPVGIYYVQGITHDNVEGFFAGGNQSTGGVASTIAKITYSTDTLGYSSANLTSTNSNNGRYYAVPVGNTTTGYFVGGQSPAHTQAMTWVDKLVYSTETLSAQPSTYQLKGKNNWGSGTSNSTHGYIAGGSSGSMDEGSTFQRITFADDTTSLLPAVTLQPNRINMAPTGNETTGYYSGGNSPNLITNKFTYSTDNIELAPNAVLPGIRYYIDGYSPVSNGLPSTAPVPVYGPCVV